MFTLYDSGEAIRYGSVLAILFGGPRMAVFQTSCFRLYIVWVLTMHSVALVRCGCYPCILSLSSVATLEGHPPTFANAEDSGTNHKPCHTTLNALKGTTVK
jgi:hypothetical protein